MGAHPIIAEKRRILPAVLTWAYVALTLLSYAAASLGSLAHKSPTFDEPLHLAGGMTVKALGDYRVDPENPPLWIRWATLRVTPLPADTSSVDWIALLDRSFRRDLPLVRRTLYADGRSPDEALAQARRMMVLISVGAGALVAFGAYRWGGRKLLAPAAAVTFFAADPNLIGHGALVKNDVVMALSLAWLSLAGASLWERLTWPGVAGAALACAVGLSSKFSGVLLPGFLAVVLLARAFRPEAWQAPGRSLATRREKLLAGATVMGAVILVSWTGIWAAYGFQSSVSPDGKNLSLTATTDQIQRYYPDKLGPAQALAAKLGDAGLVPQPWAQGLRYTYFNAINRTSFVLGQYGVRGHWWYFPFAVAVKEPIGTLAAGLLALSLAIARRRAWLSPTAIALAIPSAGYFLVALTTSLNLGVRHMLPAFPICFVGIGIATANLWDERRRTALAAMLALLLATLAESAAAFPNDIAFFNLPARSASEPMRLLDDSNLDWGQDLPLLADWQKSHPDEHLFLAPFTLVPPEHYGIKYTLLPGAPVTEGARLPAPGETGVIAISTNVLMGIESQTTRDFYAPLRNDKPIAILGGTIYLYRLGTPR